jgi:myo-inositol-1(or 4)-monophosphatase
MYLKELEVIRTTVNSIVDKLMTTDFIINTKQDDDIVTSMDLFVESKLIEVLNKEFKTDHILSEETNNHTNLIGRTWIIDPIDGTSNFASHLDLYCIQVALYENGQLVFAYIYIPQTKKEYYAIKDGGAYLNNQRITTKQDPKISNRLMSIIGCFRRPTTKNSLPVKLMEACINANLKLRNLGSVGVELALIAEGVYSVLYTPITNLYDIAPGLLIAKEAGSIITNYHFNEYTLGEKGMFVFSNEAVKEKMLEILKVGEF